MANFAVLDENNVVVNVIIAETIEDAESVTKKTCMQYDDQNIAAIGWRYDSNLNVFVQPPRPEEITE